jgi:hypothetical protein
VVQNHIDQVDADTKKGPEIFSGPFGFDFEFILCGKCRLLGADCDRYGCGRRADVGGVAAVDGGDAVYVGGWAATASGAGTAAATFEACGDADE